MKNPSPGVLGFVIPSEKQHGAVTKTKTPVKHATATPLFFERKTVPNTLKFPQWVMSKTDGWNYILLLKVANKLM
jgi:hypothetical protein